MRAVLVATMRNEGPYLLEWITWHRLVGFTDFVICTNDCVDGSPELLDLLDVHHIRCAPGPNDQPQLFAYAQAEEVVKALRPDWLMVLDADEFLNIHVGSGCITDLLACVPDATAFMINWRVFGSAGFEHWSPVPVTRRFTRCAVPDHGVNASFKTLFSQVDAYHSLLLPHGPGFARPERVADLRPVDSAGEPLSNRYARAEEFLQIGPRPDLSRLAQINHYNTRSWEDYLVKHDRTGGLGRWDRDTNWPAFDRNEEEDLSIQRRTSALERALSELLAEPAVAAAHQRCCALYDAHVARLRRAAA
jgi:hypothetical protein